MILLIKPVTDTAFAAYGKVVDGYDFAPMLEALSHLPCPADSVTYQPGVPELESLAVYAQIRDRFYGGMPIQIGYCSGYNKSLNGLEYHRDSELNVPLVDMVVLLAKLQDIRNYTLDTSLVEAFFVPAGTAVQFYETTLHYAPCTAKGEKGFCTAVVLPLHTNTQKPDITPQNDEDKLLWARNKWLLAHPDSSEAGDGAFVGLTGKNITIE